MDEEELQAYGDGFSEEDFDFGGNWRQKAEQYPDDIEASFCEDLPGSEYIGEFQELYFE